MATTPGQARPTEAIAGPAAIDRAASFLTPSGPSMAGCREGVTRVLVQTALTGHEAKLQAELAELLRRTEVGRQRIRVVRRTLERIAEEREAGTIDRILGVATR